MLNTSLFIHMYIVLTSSICLLKNYKTNPINKFRYDCFNLISIFTLIASLTLINIFNLPQTYSKLSLILTLSTLIIFILLNKNTLINFSVLIVASLLFLVSYCNNFLELFLILELINILLIFLIVIDKSVTSTYNKQKFSILITLNLVVLISAVISYIVSIKTIGSSNIDFIWLNMLICPNTYQSFALLSFILLKLGVITGPLISINFYKTINSQLLIVYLSFYYLIYPIILLKIIFIVKIHYTITILILIINLLLNMVNLKNLSNYRELIFLSGQVNLIYIFLIFIN